ncbi:IucA/IucC family protein [Phaeacidiphilus oryzae]|uniref:IucA/IucC family protein n=1 Tax=Phaeacidiphilus oryzae TaxID=348818 RepID=UPI0005630090|nr:IucA/IucC family protein [Phaeacidiphilus oryzae]
MPQPVERSAELCRPAGLDAQAWRRASRRLLEKAIAEFCYEEILTPEPTGPTPAAARSPEASAAPSEGREAPSEGREGPEAREAPDAGYRIGPYEFRARRGAYRGWRIVPGSVRRDGEPATDPLALLLDLRDELGVAGDTAGHLVRELTATLLADVSLDLRCPSAKELADLDYAELEGHQTGHPWLVANKGRVGFSATDAERWAPEARRPAVLPWIAVHRSLADYRGVPGLPAERLYAEELGEEAAARFRAAITGRGRDPEEYLLLPVHPWQWDETIVPFFAPHLADDTIIPLGPDGETRLPQQSVRTFLNLGRPAGRTVKLPLSVLNTMVWRGLPTERTRSAPAVTAWVQGLRAADPYLRDECRVALLGETASVTVRHPLLESIPGVPYQYRELLGAIWREPLADHLEPGERARTLAALLQTDRTGRALTAELVARSGAGARAWTRALFGALLPPLLHFLYRYGTVFSPHGENAIVVFDERDLPVRLAVKDFVDDVNVSAVPLPELDGMPDEVARVLLREEPDYLCQFIHSGLLVGVFRYLAPLMEDQLGLPEDEFWTLLRDTVLAEQSRFPELRSRHRLFDLLTPRIDRLCLNRNRLLLDGYRDRATRPHVAAYGTVPNPLASPKG